MAAEDELAVGLHGHGADHVGGHVGDERTLDGPVGEHAHDAVATMAAQRGEIADHHDAAVGLEGELPDAVVGVGDEAGVERAVGAEAGESVAGPAGEDGKRAADHDPSIRLDDDIVDREVRRGVEGAEHPGGPDDGEAAPGLIADARKTPREEHATVHQRNDAGDRAARRHAGIERGVERIGRRDAGEADAAGTVDRGKRAADEECPAGLQGQGRHTGRFAAVEGEIERRVERALGIEARDEPPRRRTRGPVGLDARKLAANDDFPVGPDHDRVDGAGGRRVKGGVERAVGIEAGEVAAGDAVDGAKRAAQKNLAVGLERERGGGAVEARRREESEVEGAVAIQAGDPLAGDRSGGAERLKRGEEAADDHPSIGLHHGGQDRIVGAGIEAIIGGGGGGGDREGHGRGARATGRGDRNIARGGAGRDDGGEGQIGYDGEGRGDSAVEADRGRAREAAAREGDRGAGEGGRRRDPADRRQARAGEAEDDVVQSGRIRAVGIFAAQIEAGEVAEDGLKIGGRGEGAVGGAHVPLGGRGQRHRNAGPARRGRRERGIALPDEAHAVAHENHVGGLVVQRADRMNQIVGERRAD